ncbi:phage tail assembly protein [Serratia marcescens]|uniref:phage tail assembly protein n=1 Tax=Serratia marcescens TaxID=615 RepID=UPI001EF113A0|nr:phage tail assembly protein [Serratia marcescens]ULH12271.1 phage tail assembly protein [Serratia marcescens]
MNDQHNTLTQDLPDRETIPLLKPVSLGDSSKVEYHEITLTEPTLEQVDSFYSEQAKSNALRAMGLLITLVSGTPNPAVKKLCIRDYKKCEAWLTRFLTWSPEKTTGEE